MDLACTVRDRSWDFDGPTFTRSSKGATRPRSPWVRWPAITSPQKPSRMTSLTQKGRCLVGLLALVGPVGRNSRCPGPFGRVENDPSKIGREVVAGEEDDVALPTRIEKAMGAPRRVGAHHDRLCDRAEASTSSTRSPDITCSPQAMELPRPIRKNGYRGGWTWGTGGVEADRYLSVGAVVPIGTSQGPRTAPCSDLSAYGCDQRDTPSHA